MLHVTGDHLDNKLITIMLETRPRPGQRLHVLGWAVCQRKKKDMALKRNDLGIALIMSKTMREIRHGAV